MAFMSWLSAASWLFVAGSSVGHAAAACRTLSVPLGRPLDRLAGLRPLAADAADKAVTDKSPAQSTTAPARKGRLLTRDT
jgi:hypothetical protein